MNLKQLSKAQKIYEEITRIDKEIINIESLAQKLANDDIQFNLQIEIEDLINTEVEPEQKLDAYPCGTPRIQFAWSLGGICNTSEAKPKTEVLKETGLNNSLSLQILGVLLYNKQQIRKGLLAQLEKMGVAI
jgi:hypothetical protein